MAGSFRCSKTMQEFWSRWEFILDPKTGKLPEGKPGRQHVRVLKAKNRQTGALVAVKRCNKYGRDVTGDRQEAIKVQNIMQLVPHTGICRFLDWCEDPQALFMVYEWACSVFFCDALYPHTKPPFDFSRCPIGWRRSRAAAPPRRPPAH